MSTPSIQTLITQAQQVLNLKSSNEIRATLAAILANANVGTPLNPNLTTQQLWDEFYEIVRQPSDDIMSIITDQMMRMVFSPPAPGGAGADKQVIFNDGGVLAGDTKFLWDKTANRLDVDGPVVITGAATVATNVLVANAAGYTGKVGVATATPADFLEVVGSGANGIRVSRAGLPTQFATLSAGATGPTLNASSALGSLTFGIAGTAATAMTLNSTGLGIGVAPVTGAKLAVAGPIVRDKGTVTATISVATTFATLPGEGLYIVYAYTNASNPAAFTSYAVILADSSGSRVVANNGTQITITTSTFALQVTQIFFPSVTVLWSYVQIG
jgi:hypothetical protein